MRKKFRLAAIDIDGTLVHGSNHVISEENRRAIVRMQREGMEVVLASGRHHSSMLKFAVQLPGVRWMVSSQGAEVSGVNRAEMLGQIFLEEPVARGAIALGRAQRFAIVVYGIDGVFRLDNEKAIAPYAWVDGAKIPFVTDAQCAAMPLFKVMWVGADEEIAKVAELPEAAALDATQVRSHTYLYELLPRGATKGTGMGILAAHLGVRADEALAFGDAENDIPLFQWAGTSVAMPGQWEAAKAAATMVAPDGPPDTAFARGVEMVLG